MGVNCNVKLNEGANWKSVGKVACVLLGAKKRREPLGFDGWSLVVEGFEYGKYEVTSMPEYLDILVVGDEENPAAKSIKGSDGPLPYRLWYGLESRGLYPKATAAKIALAEGITKFFGGKIVYNDSTGQKRVFPTLVNFVGDGDASFYRFQTALESLKPLKQKDLDRCAKYASY